MRGVVGLNVDGITLDSEIVTRTLDRGRLIRLDSVVRKVSFRANPCGILYLFCAVVLAAAQTNGVDKLDHVRETLQSGNFKEAESQLSAEISRNPRSAATHELLAFAEWKLGRIAEAVREYRTAIRLGPNSFASHYNLALLYLQQSKIESAFPELEDAARLAPANADVQYNYAVVLLQKNHGDEALARLLRVRQLQPDRADAQFQLIRAYLILNHSADAQKAAGTFTANHPEGVLPVGRAFLEAGQVNAAVLYLQDAVRMQPEDENVRSLLAEALIGSKRYRDALALLKDPATGFGHYAKAQALLDTGGLQDALMESGKAVELEPANARYLLLEGQLLERANDAHAIAFIDRAIAADPNWFEPRYNRAVCSYLQRDYHAAELELAAALRTNTRCARCLFLMGVVHFNRGEWAMALAAFRQAISIEPENARFYTHFGVALFSSGLPAQAEAALRKAISLDANYALAHFQFGKLLARTARLKQAARELEESRSLNPHLTQASYQLAKIYAKLGDRAAAEHALAEFREQKANAADDPALRNDLAFSLLQ